jgi:hypothetical protein
MRMLDSRHGSRFPLESLHRITTALPGKKWDLERNPAVQLLVVRQINSTHAATSQLPLDAITTELVRYVDVRSAVAGNHQRPRGGQFD